MKILYIAGAGMALGQCAPASCEPTPAPPPVEECLAASSMTDSDTHGEITVWYGPFEGQRGPVPRGYSEGDDPCIHEYDYWKITQQE